MAEVLRLAQLVQHHRVPEVDVGRGRVEAELDAQRLAAGELLRELRLDEELVRAAPEDVEVPRDVVRGGRHRVSRSATARCAAGRA